MPASIALKPIIKSKSNMLALVSANVVQPASRLYYQYSILATTLNFIKTWLSYQSNRDKLEKMRISQ